LSVPNAGVGAGGNNTVWRKAGRVNGGGAKMACSWSSVNHFNTIWKGQLLFTNLKR